MEYKQAEEKLQKWVMSQRWLVKAIRVFLRSAPKEAKFSIVGGAVRDVLLEGKPPKDIDLLVSDSCEEEVYEMLTLMLARKQIKDFKKVGQSFPVFKVKFVGLKEPIDLALARQEVSTGKGHKDFRYTSNYISARVDSNRRDFTINALYCGLKMVEGKIRVHLQDFHEGLEDLSNFTLACVGEGAARFREDPLRILRAIRFRSQLKLSISSRTWVQMAFRAHLTQHLSYERVHYEFIKAASSDFSQTLDYFADLELFDVIFSPMEGYDAFPTFDCRFIGEHQEIPEELVWPLTVLSRKGSDWHDMSLQIKTLGRIMSPQEKRSVAILNGLSKLLTRLDTLFPDTYLEEVRESRHGNLIEQLYNILKLPHCWPDLERVNPYIPERVNGGDLQDWGLKPSPRFSFILRSLREFQIKGINSRVKFKKWALANEFEGEE